MLHNIKNPVSNPCRFY